MIEKRPLCEEDMDNINWKNSIPIPVCEDYPQFDILYQKSWELAYEHIKEIEGMPQTPYMDEAFCDTQIWIWDTCFMSMFCKFAGDIFPGIESLDNFYEVLYNGKKLPAVIPTENEPEWTHAAPGIPKNIEVHIADNPPFFAWAEYENALFSTDINRIEHLLYKTQVLQKHYEWMENLTEQQTPENVHCETCLIAEKYGYKWEGGRSGMDNTPRGRRGNKAECERPNNPDMLWLDAICQQALSAKMIAKLFDIVGDEENRKKWEQRYLEKKDIVNELYWDEKDGFYYDIDSKTHEFYKVVTPAAFWTLVAEIATKEKAKRLSEKLFDENLLGGKIPAVSLARNDADFVATGGYWRGAMWLPTAFVTLKGLCEYDLYDEAHTVGKKILDHMLRTYLEYEPHTIWECYSPTEYKPATTADGKGIVRKDFCGWSALGPISIYIENVLGFHTINGFERVVEWAKADTFEKKVGIKNLRFANIVTDIIAENGICKVISNAPYTLKINDKPYQISAGENILNI